MATEAFLPARPTLARRIFHLTASGVLGFLGLVFPSAVVVPLTGALTGLALAVEMLRMAFPSLNARLVRLFGVFLKRREAHTLTAATLLAGAALIAYLVFPTRVAGLALMFTAVGDPVAGLVGSRVGGPRLWGKSPVGTGAFFLACVALGGVLSLAGLVRFGPYLVVGALVASAVEMLPMGIDDNVRVPLLAGLAMTLTP